MMARRQKSYEYGRSGWAREARAEDVEDRVKGRLGGAEDRAYQSAYRDAMRLKTEGVSPDEIRAALVQAPRRLGPLPDGRYPIDREAHDIAEHQLLETRRSAIEDADNGEVTPVLMFPDGRCQLWLLN